LSLSYGAGWKSSYVTQSSRVLEGTTKTVNVFDYDLRGRTTSESSKLVDGNNSDIVDPTAPITTRGYVYDGLSRITRKTLTTGGVTNTLYKRDFNDSALTVTTTDAKGYRTVASYDSFFRKVLEERFRPNTENQNAEYDGTGQVSVGKMSWSYNPAHRNKVSQEKVYGAPDGSLWFGTG
jgi:YD repeat-containing protein